MYSNRNRRLEALEALEVTSQRRSLRGLVGLYAAGLLKIEHCTDTELWWLLTGKEEPFPGWDEFEKVMNETN